MHLEPLVEVFPHLFLEEETDKCNRKNIDFKKIRLWVVSKAKHSHTKATILVVKALFIVKKRMCK